MSIQHRLTFSLPLVLCFGSLVGLIVTVAPPHPAVADARDGLRLMLLVMVVLVAAALLYVVVSIKVAFRPLGDIGDALTRANLGDYEVALRSDVAAELVPLRGAVIGAVARLVELDKQNTALKEQIADVQEAERAELGRDLHDDIAPLLFGIEADAAMIGHYLAVGSPNEAKVRAEAIADAVRHLQRRLKDVLRRLAPAGLLESGLAGAIENVVAFWKRRYPHCTFVTTFSGGTLDAPLDAAAFRVVQESVSNAMRHGGPSMIDVSIAVGHDGARIVVRDDGIGFPGGATQPGFGLAGLQARVRSLGGTASVRNRTTERGVIVEVSLPLRATIAGAAYGLGTPA